MAVVECNIGKLKIHIRSMFDMKVSISISEVEITLSPLNWGKVTQLLP